jgi:hypothetical protein
MSSRVFRVTVCCDMPPMEGKLEQNQSIQEPIRSVLNVLLSQLATCISGAVDTWTVLCVSDEKDFKASALHIFLENNLEIVRAHVIVIRTLLHRTHYPTPAKELIDGMLHASTLLGESFQILECYKKVEAHELEDGIHKLATAYHSMLSAIRSLSQATGCGVSELDERSAKREEYYQRMLDTLYGIMMKERGS